MKNILVFIFVFLTDYIAFSQVVKHSFGDKAPLEINKSVVEKVAVNCQSELWCFPANEEIEKAPTGFNLFGAERKAKLARTIEGVEPPSIVKTEVLKNNNLLVIWPVKFRHNNQPFSIYSTCNVFIPSQIDVVLLNEANGNIIWKTRINASGTYRIAENEKSIIINSCDYDDVGIPFHHKITVLQKSDGKILWEYGGKDIYYITANPEINIAAITRRDTIYENTYVFMLASLENGNILFQQKLSDSDLEFNPLFIGDSILFKKGSDLEMYNYINKEIIRKFKTGDSLLSDRIWTDGRTLYMPYPHRIEAVDMADGQIRWIFQNDCSDIVGITGIDNNLYLFTLQNELIALDKQDEKLVNDKISLLHYAKLFKNGPLTSIDIDKYKHHLGIVSISPSGDKKWTYSTQGELMSSLYLKDNKLFFTIRDCLFEIGNSDGVLLKKATLVHDKELSTNTVNFINDNIIIKNEKYVYCFDKDFKIRYIHEFDLVWPTISTNDLIKDKLAGEWIMTHLVLQKKYGYKNVDIKYMKDNTINGTYGRNMQTELIASQARLFGNTFYNSIMAPSYMHAMDGTYVSNMQSLNAMSSSINSLMSMLKSVEASTIIAQIQAFRAQLMAYPFIKDEIDNISKFDNENRVLRLVNKAIDGQKFIALEMLELQNGTVKVQILSPFQFKSYYSTMYLEPATTLALNGYVPVVNLMDHVLRTTIDLEKNLLFHYGPGMDTDSYIFYDPEEKIYTRGKLICIPLNFRVEKKYL